MVTVGSRISRWQPALSATRPEDMHVFSDGHAAREQSTIGSGSGHGPPATLQCDYTPPPRVSGSENEVPQIRGVFLNYDPIHTKK